MGRGSSPEVCRAAPGPPKGAAEPAPGLILVGLSLPVQGQLKPSIMEPTAGAHPQSGWEKILGVPEDLRGPAGVPVQV